MFSLCFKKITPPAISDDDVATFADREHAHRTRLAGLMALVLALALIILLTFKSQITSFTSDSRLLRLCDLCGNTDSCGCGRDCCPMDPDKTKAGLCGCGVPDTDTDGDGTPDFCKDDCPRDASKTSPGACGCGIPDTDTDGDGTPDCKDSCPRDAAKTSSGICGCVIPDTDLDGDGTPDCHDRCPGDVTKTSYGVCGCGAPDTDTNGDGTLDCHSDCIDNDPFLLRICELNREFDCEGCGGKYIKVWKDCGLMCLNGIDYCLNYTEETWYLFDKNLQNYQYHNGHQKIIQTGSHSSNSILEIWHSHDAITEGVQYWFVNSLPCAATGNDAGGCLVCDDGNVYCTEDRVPPLHSNPLFVFGDEAKSLFNACFSPDLV